ncbi:MAG: Gfo/Idh/MocA family protein [Gammaproteobacteria bacterium]
MHIAIIGCGFVADYYLTTLKLHPELILLGVMDRDSQRAERFANFHGLTVYPTLDALLSDERVEIVLNLTNPDSHYEVSKACLEAGKHVYSEKPLAMRFEDALELVELAETSGLQISGAPCSLLSESAQTLWKALREKAIGDVYAVYAEMDDGLVHRMPYRKWFSASGNPWPAHDEFEVGCTLEHAGYVLGWLPAFFGPAVTVTAFSSEQIADKETDQALTRHAPDVSVACIRFASGVVARLSCSIIAPHDHGLRVFGREGILSVKDVWHYRSAVCLQRLINIRRKMILNPFKKRLPLRGSHIAKAKTGGAQTMDFCRGVAELASAIQENRVSALSPRFSLHVTELALAIHNAGVNGSAYRVKSTFEAITPMDWAK